MGATMSRATARKPPTLLNESALGRARHGDRVLVRRGKQTVSVPYPLKHGISSGLPPTIVTIGRFR